MKLEMMGRSSSAGANKQGPGREAKRKALIPKDPSAAPHTQLCVWVQNERERVWGRTGMQSVASDRL